MFAYLRNMKTKTRPNLKTKASTSSLSALRVKLKQCLEVICQRRFLRYRLRCLELSYSWLSTRRRRYQASLSCALWSPSPPAWRCDNFYFTLTHTYFSCHSSLFWSLELVHAVTYQSLTLANTAGRVQRQAHCVGFLRAMVRLLPRDRPCAASSGEASRQSGKRAHHRRHRVSEP